MRWAAVQASCWAWRGVGAHEKETVLWVLPRGLITIVLALEITQVMGAQMANLPDLAFAVIFLTNLLVVVGGLRVVKSGQPALPVQLPTDGSQASERT